MNMFARKPKTTNSQTTDESNRKKFASKILDPKKDLNSRLRYLKSYIESSDNVSELKQFFDLNFSQIYFIFYESFINVEINLKQKINKINKEELETVLFIFQKILILQPERIHHRWQVRSIGRILQRLLHIGNPKYVKINGLRLFLIWYQILNTNRTHVEEHMFQKLIQGFDIFHSSVQVGGTILNTSIGLDMLNAEAQKVFSQYDPSTHSPSHAASSISRSIYPFEITPLIHQNPNEQAVVFSQLQQQQSQPNQQLQNQYMSQSQIQNAQQQHHHHHHQTQPQLQHQQQQNQLQTQHSNVSQNQNSSNLNSNNVYNLTAELLKNMLEFMQQDCLTIEWNGDKASQSFKCYEFLFEELKHFYLAYMFPSAFIPDRNPNLLTTSVAHQQFSLNIYSNIDFLSLVKEHMVASMERPVLPNDEKKITQLHCKEEIIKWLISVLLIEPNPNQAAGTPISSTSTSTLAASSNQFFSNTHSTSISSSSISTNTTGAPGASSAGAPVSASINSINSAAAINNPNAQQSGAINLNNEEMFAQSNSFQMLNSVASSTADLANKNYFSKNDDNETDTLKANQEYSFKDFESSDMQYSTLSISTSASTLVNSNNQQLNHKFFNKQLAQNVILSTTNNVNLIHEILKNAYFLNFEDNATVKMVLDANKKWFLKEAKTPSFMLEPNEAGAGSSDDDKTSLILMSEQKMLDMSQRTSSVSSASSAFNLSLMLNQTTYNNINNHTRVGYTKCLQIFFYHSCNLLLNRNNLQKDKIKNVSCYLLEIYKLFIKKIKMDHNTWTLLISILLRVSEFLFNSEFIINNRSEPACTQLIKSTTEALLSAIIKSSLNYSMSNELWDHLMTLISSVNSNVDVVEKWMESIDELIRQIIKYSYNIDINNLPVSQLTIEQKRKLKKKNNLNSILDTANSVQFNSASTAYQQQKIQNQTFTPTSVAFLNGSNNQQNQHLNIVGKPRSRTEIYPSIKPSSSSSSKSPSHIVNTPSLVSYEQDLSSSKNLNSKIQNSLNQSVDKSFADSKKMTNFISMDQSTTSVKQPKTKTQTSTKIQNTFRDDTYLPTLGSSSANEINTIKFPSLSDDNFMATLNSREQNAVNKGENVGNGGGGGENYLKKNVKLTKTDNATMEFDDDMFSDENGDKSATLKANVNSNDSSKSFKEHGDCHNVMSEGETNDKVINRFNSDKSIYYSSELLAETNTSNQNNSIVMGENDNNSSIGSNNQSNNNSFSASPLISTNLSGNKMANGQQPPPLPPLPTSFSTKFFSINKNKSDYEPDSKQQTPTSQVSTLTGSNNNNNSNEFNGNYSSDTSRNDRKSKVGSISGDFDVCMKEFINTSAPQVDTNSEATSLSGGELSGDTFASPSLNAYNTTDSSSVQSIQFGPTSGATNTIYIEQTDSGAPSSSLLIQALNSENLITNSNLNSENNMNNSAANNSLKYNLPQRSNENGSNLEKVERSASFIDTKYINDFYLKTNKLSDANSSVNLPTANNSQMLNSSITYSQLNSSSVFKESALILLKRLIGCLGNLNSIKDPSIHRKVFEFLFTKWEKLGKIRDDLKIDDDLSKVVMPLSYFAPWLFEAIYQLPSIYQSGKLIAIKALCYIVIRSANYNLLQFNNEFDSISEEFMDLFYITIHQGLRSNDKNIINCIISNCGTKFWHCMLPSSTLLIKDFVEACALSDTPSSKLDAASILGCLLFFPDYFGDLKVLCEVKPGAISQITSDANVSGSLNESVTSQAQTTSPTISPSSNSNNSVSQDLTNQETLAVEFYHKEELKNLIIQTLVDFNEDYFNNDTRCVIVCALTCYIYDEILSQRWNLRRLNDAIKRIFKDLDFKEQFNPVLIKISCENLRFLSCLSTLIFQKEIQYAINIINELNQCLVKLINARPIIINEDYEKAIIANMFALLEWCMNMPLEQLKDQDRATLLRNNFKLIIHISNTFKPNESIEAEHIHLSAKFIVTHLLNQLNNFPFGLWGSSKIVSTVNETSDLDLNMDELSPILFEQSNIQFFTVNNQFLITLIELPMKNNEKYFDVSGKLKISDSVCRFVIRDFSAKSCWDCCVFQSIDDTLPNSYNLEIPLKKKNSELVKDTLSPNDPAPVQDVPFDFNLITELKVDQIPKKIDILENIMLNLNYTSPECRFDSNKPLNLVWDINLNINSNLNVDNVTEKIDSQSQVEKNHNLEMKNIINLNLTSKKSYKSLADLDHQKENTVPNAETQSKSMVHQYFHLCKSFVHQMGLLSWEKRQSFNLLHKSSQLLRELKSLDDQTCRETHKIAIIYIGEGQEDKMSILSNEFGSKDYEEFLNALAWPVDLEKHQGFIGGLQHNNVFKTALYYANSTSEVLFHVSTLMNNENDQNKISKWRHLGNDSVQIIWSDHYKDYDRNILATEFADVLICIYPLKNGLYKVQIIKKSSVGHFGPLFNGAILNKQDLPTLIRATAINASRVLLSNTKGYKDFYVHRAHTINNIVKTQTEKQTYEQFIVDLYSPTIPNVNNTNQSAKKELAIDKNHDNLEYLRPNM